MNFMDPEAEVPPDFTFSTWELAFRQLALFAQTRRVALFIDEITYIIDVDSKFVGVLQKVWDRWLSDSNVMLAFAGSQMGLMRQHLLDYDAPLYGRATSQMQLPPLPYGTTYDYFPEYTAEERVKLYAMWGGVPAYWERLDANLSITDNLRRNILPAHAWMIDESRILLQDFITDLNNYVGILRAISDGQQLMSDISSRTGLNSSKASFYLSVLRDTGFVVRDVPISQRNTDSRRGRYIITDPYLRFFTASCLPPNPSWRWVRWTRCWTWFEKHCPPLLVITPGQSYAGSGCCGPTLQGVCHCLLRMLAASGAKTTSSMWWAPVKKRTA